MKRVIVLSGFLIVSLAVSSCGRKPNTDGVDLPDQVLVAFNAKYSDVADVKWQKLSQNGKDIYEADFTRKGKSVTIQYNDTGSVVKE
jgi:hypothetical protein